MIRVIRKDNEIKVIGHAGYAEYGKDIICCAVSVLEDYTIQLLKKFDINFSSDESNGYLKIVLNDDNLIGITIFEEFYKSLRELSEDYKNYIRMED